MADRILSAAQARGNLTVIPTTVRTCADAAESYLAAGGEARYLHRIVAYFSDRPIHSIYPYDIREMAETLYPTASSATRNRQALTPARAVIMHAYDRGWCDLIRIRSFKVDKPRAKRPASQIWLHSFCRQADRDRLPHLAGLVLFMATTGARISEAIALRWPEVDLTGRTALLVKTKTGTNSTRFLTDDVAERLRRLQAARGRQDRVFRYTSRFSVSERLKAVCRRAEIPYKSPHLCGRHTFATTAIEMGVDIGTAMAAGDWRSSKVFLETYVHPRVDAGRMVADRFNHHAFAEM
jgi:integrase